MKLNGRLKSLAVFKNTCHNNHPSHNIHKVFINSSQLERGSK